MIWNPTPTHRRRSGARIPVESLCAEVVEEHERFGIVVDVSEDGLRLERPLAGKQARVVQLEFEIPEVDELMWAKAELCFDRVRPSPDGVVRSSGVRLVAAAQRHLRMLRDYVVARRERLSQAVADLGGPAAVDDALLRAAHWLG
jgi:PilZ domain